MRGALTETRRAAVAAEGQMDVNPPLRLRHLEPLAFAHARDVQLTPADQALLGQVELHQALGGGHKGAQSRVDPALLQRRKQEGEERLWLAILQSSSHVPQQLAALGSSCWS